MLSHFFLGRDFRAFALKQKEFLLKAMGVATEYTGLPPAKAHGKLPPIWRGMFDRRLVILREVLVGAGLANEHVDAWVEFESSFREVVQK